MTTTVKPESFRTTVDLTIPYGDNVYQLVYASQLHGTLFGVYGMFDAQKVSEKQYKITKINFRLINYKGCVNIGLDAIKLSKKDDKDVIEIYVSPLKKKDELNFRFRENFVVGNGKEIIFLRYLKPFHPKITGNTSGTNENGEISRQHIFFDEEFNYRDGYYEIAGPTRAGHEGVEWLGSPRCHQSNVMLKF